jgi:hypothetical protein
MRAVIKPLLSLCTTAATLAIGVLGLIMMLAPFAAPGSLAYRLARALGAPL